MNRVLGTVFGLALSVLAGCQKSPSSFQEEVRELKQPAKESEPKLPAMRTPGEEFEVEIAPGVKMTFCWVPAGKATLG